MNQVSAPSKRKVCVSIGNPRIALSVIWGHSDCRTIILIWKNFCLSSDCCGVILRNKCLAQTFCLWCYTRGYVYKWFLRLSLLLGSWLAILTISWYDTSFFPLRFYSKDNFPSGLHSKIVLLLLTLLKKKKKASQMCKGIFKGYNGCFLLGDNYPWICCISASLLSQSINFHLVSGCLSLDVCVSLGRLRSVSL